LSLSLAVVLLRALPNLRYPLGRDQATYCVIGQGLLHGKLLYRDLWDNKPPGIFWIYALIVKTFGPVMWCVGLVDILWLLVFSCCIFYFARRYLGNAGAVLSVIFYAFRHCQKGYIHAAQPEAFLMLGVFAAWFLLGGTRWKVARHLVVGLLLGAAFWLKYSAVAFFPFLALLPFVDFRGLDRLPGRTSPHRGAPNDALSRQESPEVQGFGVRLTVPWRDWLLRMLLVAAGFVFAVAAVFVYFRLSGAWLAMKEVQFEVLPRYGAMSFNWSLAYFYFALRQTFNHLGFWWEAMPAAALLLAWQRREVGRTAPIFFMALGGYLSTAMQGRFHTYYFETCFPFFAMFWGYVLVCTYRAFQYLHRVMRARRWALAGVLVWVVFASIVGALLPEEVVRLGSDYGYLADWRRNPEVSYQVYWWQLPLDKFGDQLRVVDYLRAHSQPQDRVYVWGTAPLINFLSQRECPSRFVSNIALQSTWAPERWRAELVGTLGAAPPRYLVVERHDTISTLTFSWRDSEQYLEVYPALAGFLRRRYQPVVNYSDFEVYRLK
jgi:hypothetical protein